MRELKCNRELFIDDDIDQWRRRLHGCIRATGVQFLPRYAMSKRGLCCRPVSVRLFIPPSVKLVDCIQTAEDIVKLLSPARQPHQSSFFDPMRRYPIPFSGDAKYTEGGEKFAIFDGNHRLSRKRCEIGL